MLEHILSKLIARAKANPGKEQTRKLKNNLHIYVSWQEPFYTMTLARDKTEPATQEMKTCIAYLPKNVSPPGMDKVRKTDHNHRQALAVDFVESQYVQAVFA